MIHLGFTPQIDLVGTPLKWESGKSTFLIYYSSEILELDKESALTQTLSQIETELDLKFVKSGNRNLADIIIEFSSNTESASNNLSEGNINFEDSHEAAKTVLSYDDNRIIKAVITLNSVFNASFDLTTSNYIGNIFSHEIGHALGLAHSGVVSSTMYPYLSKGQHIFEEDDLNLLRGYFGSSKSSFSGKIHGRIKSTADGPGIFGVTIDLINLTPPFSIISTFTEYDGSFSFNNVDKSQKYLVRVKPGNYEKEYPSYLSFGLFDLCSSNLEFSPFFINTNCEEKSLGNPYVISFKNSDIIDLRDIGIRCVEESDSSFLDGIASDKLFEFNNLVPAVKKFGFWAQEISYLNDWQKEIKIKVNISDLKSYLGESALVRIGVISHKIDSKSPMNMSIFSDEDFETEFIKVSGNSHQNTQLFNVPFNSLGEVNLDNSVDLRLDQVSQEAVYLKGVALDLKDYLNLDLTMNEKQMFSIINKQEQEVSRAILFLDVLSSQKTFYEKNYRGTGQCAEGIRGYSFPDLKHGEKGQSSNSSSSASSGSAIFDCSAGAGSTFTQKSSLGMLYSITLGVLFMIFLRLLGRLFQAFYQILK
jgi:hypothetical protein